MKQLVFETQAARDIHSLDPTVQRRVTAALLRYARHGHGDVKKLSGVGPPSEYRMRAGDWRIIFLENNESVSVLRVLHRSKAYR